MKRFKAGANKFFKQLLCLALCAVMLLGLLPPLEASAATIKNSKIVKDPQADTYALTPELQETLNQILNGDINLFSDKEHKHKVSAKMNSQPVKSGTTRYVTSAHATPDKTKNVSGQTCSIYAMAVYSTLFDATVFNQKAYKSTTILSAGGNETSGWGKEK